MGIFKLFSDGCEEYDSPTIIDKVTKSMNKLLLSYPNPKRFTVNNETVVGDTVIVDITYPDCKNHNGRKIMVYDSIVRWNTLKLLEDIDPHFLDSTYSPSARFEPTTIGMILAMKCATELNKLEE